MNNDPKILHTMFSRSFLRTKVAENGRFIRESTKGEDVDEGVNKICVLANMKRGNLNKFVPTIDLSKSADITNALKISTPTRWIELIGKYRVHRFPEQTALPKVQLSKKPTTGQAPKDVVVDRLRRKFGKIKLEDELIKAGIREADLYPANDQYSLLSEYAFEHFLPISYFDNEKYDCNSPAAWLKLGYYDNKIYHIPLRAFLPINKSLFRFSWQLGAAMKYSPSTNLWTIRTIWEEEVFEIPRIQLMFLGEDPLNFVRRIRKAVKRRNKAENVVRFHNVVDSILYGDLKNHSINFVRQSKIDDMLEKLECKPSIWKKIHDEIYLVFEHLMACYEFQKFTKLRPKEFLMYKDVVLKDVVPARFPSKLSQDILDYNSTLHVDLKETSFKVLQETFYYNKDAIEAMEHAHRQCQAIENQYLFLLNLAKAVTLTDFLQVQQQNSNHVTTHLKTFWPTKLTSGVILVLRQLGKGWLDIRLSDWTVFELSKICRFVFQIKLRMEESVQILLEESMRIFIDYLCAPCEQFLNLTTKFVWTNNHNVTHFPYDKPFFYLTIGVSDAGKVVYSTTPEEFEPTLQDCYKQTLERTGGIRCVDYAIMLNLRFDPLYILTVELVENLYIETSAYLSKCYKQAVIPLNAYSKLYERYISFCLINVNEYMNEYIAAKKSSAEVKADILDHKKQKEEIRDILPDFITIGPFYVNVENIKTSMLKKHTEINRRIFEYYVDRMFEKNQEILNQANEMFTKINTPPISIENLYEINDYVKLLPQLIEEMKGDLQVMILEYDVLDFFFYNLTDTQFAMKWDAIAWPLKIIQRLSTLRDEQALDIDNFKRIHIIEVGEYDGKLDSLNDEIQNYSLIFDPGKVAEVAVNVKNTWHAIMAVKDEGEILKFREGLFDVEQKLSFEKLDSLISSFTPYKDLWSAGLEIKKLEDATCGNPISTIDLDHVAKQIDEYRSQLQHSYMNFREHPEIQGVAKTFLHTLEHFVPIFLCIKDMANENFLMYHWQELAQRSGLDIKYSPAINFQSLIRKGILNFLDLIREIGTRAVIEAVELKKRLEEEERKKEEERRILEARKESRKCRRDIL